MKCQKCGMVIISGVDLNIRVDITRNPDSDIGTPQMTLYSNISLCSKCSLDDQLAMLVKQIKKLIEAVE